MALENREKLNAIFDIVLINIMANPWLVHLKKVWAVQKKKGKSYRETMTIAKKSYKRGAAAKDEAPKKRRRRKKKAQ